MRDGINLLSSSKASDSLTKLTDALLRFDGALHAPLDAGGYMREARLQCFEISIELCWKTLKHFLEANGTLTSLPREAIQRAYQAGWIDEEPVWLAMMRDRNHLSHTYNEALAISIHERLPQYCHSMQHVAGWLRQQTEKTA